MIVKLKPWQRIAYPILAIVTTPFLYPIIVYNALKAMATGKCNFWWK